MWHYIEKMAKPLNPSFKGNDVFFVSLNCDLHGSAIYPLLKGAHTTDSKAAKSEYMALPGLPHAKVFITS
ncbi:hypothetical protein PIL02S_01954 [Paenibacillus illinoisensis]|uniref:Uncharacterized protein n=1 Tax=Paenibacillus illinoisensis TaxID=59845 RepID=A0A2W0CCM8_9BACL|nr:hypothetical protein PIL02S_01954 [Paenibacillus illinoisensis]